MESDVLAFVAKAPSGGKLMLIILGLAALMVLLFLPLYFAARKPGYPSRIQLLGPSFFFWLGLIYLGFLLAGAVLYNADFYGVQENVRPTIGGVLPIAIPWFGALGAVTISLYGVFDHNSSGNADPKKNWDPRFNYWHIARPLFGAVLAIIAYFIFITLIQSTNATPNIPNANPSSAAVSPTPSSPGASPSPGTSPSGGASGVNTPLVYYILAFLVGYREDTFRALIKKATDLLLGPGDGASGQPTPGAAGTPSAPGAQGPPGAPGPTVSS